MRIVAILAVVLGIPLAFACGGEAIHAHIIFSASQDITGNQCQVFLAAEADGLNKPTLKWSRIDNGGETQPSSDGVYIVNIKHGDTVRVKLVVSWIGRSDGVAVRDVTCGGLV